MSTPSALERALLAGFWVHVHPPLVSQGYAVRMSRKRGPVHEQIVKLAADVDPLIAGWLDKEEADRAAFLASLPPGHREIVRTESPDYRDRHGQWRLDLSCGHRIVTASYKGPLRSAHCDACSAGTSREGGAT